MGKKKEEEERMEKEQMDIARIRLPRGNQVMGLLDQRLGASRVRVKCLDGKTRICRIPGRLKRRLWVREGDIVIIEPWELGGDEKGDVVFKYNKTQTIYLQKNGYLSKFEDTEEF